MLAAEKPIEAITKRATAAGQWPRATKGSAAVITMAMAVNTARYFFFADPRSAIAPRTGASNATRMLAVELATPSCSVLAVGSLPALQYCLRNSGKKAVITISANAELAQS